MIKTKINVNFILLTAFVTAFLVNFVVPIGKTTIQVSYILIYLSFFIILFLKQKQFLGFIKKIITNKLNLLTYFMYFLLTITVSSLLLILFKKVYIPSLLFSFIGGIILQILLSIVFGIYISYKTFYIKHLVKIIYMTCFIICLLGIINFLAAFLHIDFITNTTSLLYNEQLITFGSYLPVVLNNGIPRAQSVFIEPSVFGGFLCLFLPVIYKLSNSKFKIFKSNLINFILKKTTLPLILVNIVLTQSPIFFIFGLIIMSILCYKKLIVLFIKRSIIIITLVLVISGLVLILNNYFNFSETYLKRIINVISVIGDFDTFVIVENSLATRIVNYYNTLCLWTKSPILGIGLGQLNLQLAAQLLKSPLPLTQEIIGILNSGIFTFNTGLFYKYIAETGLIGISFLYIFLIKLIKTLNRTSHYLNGIEKDFCISLRYFITTFIGLSFYNIGYLDSYIWILIGVGIGLCYKVLIKGNNGNNNDCNTNM